MTFLRLVLGLWLTLCILLNASSVDSRIPDEVRYKSGYVNPVPKPPNFTSAMLWGIAIADTRFHGHEKAQIEIAHTTLSCRVDGRDVTLNDDRGDVRGGLYRRHPWFGTDAHDPIPLVHSPDRAYQTKPSSLCALASVLTGCGTSGALLLGLFCRLAISKAAQ